MKVLIATQNRDIISRYYPKVKFTDSTKNTPLFKVSTQKFKDLYFKAKQDGYNPYALMTPVGDNFN